jgi:lipopolysaccharide transport system ATP-binding protein
LHSNKSKNTNQKVFWALQNVNLKIKKGEVIGIIGSNGSGKSTLLKLIARITNPSRGKITTIGSITSLLGLGIGFHSELSGRENIFLSGALLGLKKKEIEKDLARIIGFSGIKKFIDTPVKYYSSGMYVRLAFSIAVSDSLNPNILLIDEVLSVGDEAFQKKSIDKIHDLIQKKQTTILMVSHNLDVIRLLCNKCIWLEKGRVVQIGNPESIISKYIATQRS